MASKKIVRSTNKVAPKKKVVVSRTAVRRPVTGTATKRTTVYTVNQKATQPTKTPASQSTNVKTSSPAPKPVKKKKHVWVKVLIPILIVGALGGGGYFAYKYFFKTEEKKEEEYTREVASGSDTITVKGKQKDKENYVITVSAKESSTYEVSEITSVKIGDEVISKDDYKYENGTITFKISFLKEHPGKITVDAKIVKIPAVKLITTTDELEVNKTFTFQAEIKDKLESDTIKWTSSNPSVATVDAEGKETCVVTGIKEGSTTIRVTVRNISATYSLKVVAERIEMTLSYKGFNKYGYEVYDQTKIDEIEYYKVYCDDVTQYQEGHFAINIPATFTPDIAEATAKPVTGFYYGYIGGSSRGAFNGCKGLEKVTFEKPENITCIDKEAFQGCTNLKYFGYLPNLVSIDTYAFFECRNIQSLTFPKSLEFIRNNAFSFASASSLDVKQIILEDTENTAWYGNRVNSKGEKEKIEFDFKDKTSEDVAKLITYNSNCGYDIFKKTNAETKLGYAGYDKMGYPETNPEEIVGYKVYCANIDRTAPKGKVTIPATYEDKDVTGFYQTKFFNDYYIYGFQDCENITEIEFEDPTKIVSIDFEAFMNCTGLTKVDLSNCANLKTIGIKAFAGCSNLNEIKVNNNLENIGQKAFFDCTSLLSFNTTEDGVCSLPSSIKKVDEYAFAYTSESKTLLTKYNKIKFNNTNNFIGINRNAFGVYDETKTQIFSKDTNNFYYFVNGEDSKYIFCGQIYDGSASILKIPEDTKIIANRVWDWTSDLDICIPSTIEYIPGEAFYFCTFKNIEFNYHHSLSVKYKIINSWSTTEETSFQPNQDQTGWTEEEKEEHNNKIHRYLEGYHQSGTSIIYAWERISS